MKKIDVIVPASTDLLQMLGEDDAAQEIRSNITALAENTLLTAIREINHANTDLPQFNKLVRSLLERGDLLETRVNTDIHEELYVVGNTYFKYSYSKGQEELWDDDLFISLEKANPTQKTVEKTVVKTIYSEW